MARPLDWDRQSRLLREARAILAGDSDAVVTMGHLLALDRCIAAQNAAIVELQQALLRHDLVGRHVH